MNTSYTFQPVAFIRNDFTEKFGIPRQSGMLDNFLSRIEFDRPFASPDAIRGIEGFSHLWLIWIFSENSPKDGRPHEGTPPLTVRPPRLGGNTRVGVFASRSPFRPNPVGLSCVKLERVEYSPVSGAPVLVVSGADLMDGTPILDIKPYVPYSDCRPGARGGFSQDGDAHVLGVVWDEKDIPVDMDAEKRENILRLLSLDPRPSYHEPGREYGVAFGGYNIRFTVRDDTLYVISAQKNV
ncbi:MAG: tRNA (N6-threonylcarbamoyladenosine(37)-N6)-methyltransferase TrmO [Clostridiales bacterium]|nr:tRNA (N6-threonylcarbamoyladenosine(37)-N6)-methyltransferase TrmO [Clostridiales bacterium]